MYKKIKKNRFIKIYNLIRITLLAESARVSYWLSKAFFKKNIWLIYETPHQAQENGYYLFKWIRQNHPEIDIYYIISKDAPGINKVNTLGNVIHYDTWLQIFFLYHAKKIISTHGLWIVPNELGFIKKWTKKHLKAKKVMLNHGVEFLKNGKEFYHKNVSELNDLVIALSQEHKNIFTNEYGFNDSEVVIAGFARLDDMIDKSETSSINNLITFMPTFRDAEDNIGENFKNTTLFLSIKKLMLDTELISFMKEKNITLGIYLHQNIQKYSHYLEEFSSSNVLVMKQGIYTVQKLLQESKLLITDYSSVLFDFVYMDKPIISYQFDYEKFISSRKEKAFINLQKDLPGDVVTTHKELIDTIKSRSLNNFTMPPLYSEKSKHFFQYNDRNNAKRIFREIEKLN